jgi:ATP-dependent Lon protease
MTLAQVLCDELIVEGHWADYIDPCSGLPVRHMKSSNEQSMNALFLIDVSDRMNNEIRSQMLNQDGNKVFSEVDSAEQLLGYR